MSFPVIYCSILSFVTRNSECLYLLGIPINLSKAFYTNFGHSSFFLKIPSKFRVFPARCQKSAKEFTKSLLTKMLVIFVKKLVISGSFSDDFEKHRLLSYDVLACIK